MAAQTAIDICNASLALLGEPPITGFNDQTNAEKQCELLYGMSKDAVLRGHPWNCAEKSAILAALVETPPFEFDAVYQLPTDCIRALRLYETAEPWRIVAGRKLATSASPVQLIYTAAITSVPQMDAQLVQAIIYHLAAQMAVVLPNKASMHAQLMQAFENVLRNARSADGQEGTPLVLSRQDAFKNARTSYRGSWLNRPWWR